MGCHSHRYRQFLHDHTLDLGGTSFVALYHFYPNILDSCHWIMECRKPSCQVFAPWQQSNPWSGGNAIFCTSESGRRRRRHELCQSHSWKLGSGMEAQDKQPM